jgi:phosphohistidine swiveling domain-containing protein
VKEMKMKFKTHRPISHRDPLNGTGTGDVGGKCMNLFEVQRSGFPVPPWFVIPAPMLDSVLGEGNRRRIRKIVNALMTAGTDRYEEAAEEIGRIISESPLPGAFKADLTAAVRGTFPEGTLLAVRSSVVGEDSTQASFAGLMDSFLNVRPEEVKEHIVRVWISAYSPRALLYRVKKGMAMDLVQTAVIVQEMVPSAVSGVMFTREKGAASDLCIIAAAYGMGEGVVTGNVETDTFRVRLESDHIEKQVAFKSCRVVADDSGDCGTVTVPVPTSMAKLPSLSDDQVLVLRDCGARLEEVFESPQDVEWTFDGKGNLFLLQSRPIVPAAPTRDGSVRVWDNANIVESYPGITLPLTFSFIQEAYETALTRAMGGLMPIKGELESIQPTFRSMLGLFEGRVYYNLLNWYRMYSFLPGFDRNKESWDSMVGIEEEIDYPAGRLSTVNRVFATLTTACRLLTVQRTASVFFTRFEKIYERFRSMDFEGMDSNSLAEVYEKIRLETGRIWHLTLYNDFAAMKYYHLLRKLCRKMDRSNELNIHDTLLGGQDTMESVAPLKSLLFLTELFRCHPDSRQLLDEDDDAIVLDRIRNDPRFEGISAALDLHLERFGDRGFEDLKLESPTFKENPASVIAMVRDCCGSGFRIEDAQDRQGEARLEAQRIVRSTIHNPIRRLFFSLVLNKARQAIVNRENMRFARTRLYGLIRRLFARMEHLFVLEGIIEGPGDLHYLTVEEVLGTVRGTCVTRDLGALVELRRTEYQMFARSELSRRFNTRGVPRFSGSSGDKAQVSFGGTAEGIGVSPGMVNGKAMVRVDPIGDNGGLTDRGRILVAGSTDPAWVFLMMSSAGIIAERGSVLSHTAIIGRELGIPTIVGVRNATQTIRDGSLVTMDGDTGEIRWQ